MFKVLFLGSGVSTAVPSIYHIVLDVNTCKVCAECMCDSQSRNRRNNVSIALLYRDPSILETQEDKCVIIDVGKTMREALLKLLPNHGVKKVDSIVLTHGHMDAIGGLDDVRDLQESERVTVTNKDTNKESIGFKVKSGPLNIYLHQETMNTIQRQFCYLTDSPIYLDKDNNVLERRVALLNFQIININDSFMIYGLPIRSFPVYHGGTYISLGFSIGLEGEFIYISDVKVIPNETMTYLKSIPKINTLVLDCLDYDGIFSHFGLNEAIEVAKILNPTTLWLTGMSCGIGDHHEMNDKLKSIRSNTFLAYDGLMLDSFRIS